ncbi:hypothetical protein [Avibacterium endocarditidis]|uniref:hypothetical protein n=1 Tax=Avibacterium endocarditidis TaxID=380674 RepID=UPI001CA54DBE|nr:hypothetical protein [Avibacterium endocarditidis]
MLKKLTLNNFTVFSNAQLDFSKKHKYYYWRKWARKIHLLKVAYSIIAVQAKLQKIKMNLQNPIYKKHMQKNSVCI